LKIPATQMLHNCSLIFCRRKYHWLSSETRTQIWGVDFKRKTLCCLGYRLSKQKMTIYSKHFGPPGYA